MEAASTRKQKQNLIYVSSTNLAESYVISSSFYTCWILSSQRILSRVGISTKTKKIGAVAAAIFIGAGNVLSSQTFNYTAKNISIPLNYYIPGGIFIKNTFSIKDYIIIFIAGILIYKFLLFEDFFRILPSNLHGPGAFSNDKGRMEVKLLQAVSQGKKKWITKWGEKYGCHSCGRKDKGYSADHIPPSFIVKNNTTIKQQYIYPQCFICANTQKFSLGRIRGKNYVNHTKIFRKCHIFIPGSAFVYFSNDYFS